MSPWIYFERIRNRFWILPTLIVFALVTAFIISLHVPTDNLDGYWASILLRSYSPEGARLILSSVATSLMTVIGVLFSVTIVVLQQVSHQYSPRVIENFIKSLSSQIMLGMYVGTFIFCILLLRQVKGSNGAGNEDLPDLSISIALSLALACIALLIHYVHHTAQSIKSTTIIRSLRSETADYIERFASFLISNGTFRADREQEPLRPHKEQLLAQRPGYLQSFFPKMIERALGGTDSALLRIKIQPGDFVEEGTLIAEIESNQPLKPKALKKLYDALELDDSRTHAQDPRYGIRQLVDIALRALSPGVNDPSTAVEAINSIGHIVWLLLRLPPLPNHIRLSQKVIIEIRHISPEEILELAFSQILFFAKDQIPVLLRVDEVLKTLEPKISHERVREIFRRQREFIRTNLGNSADLALHSRAQDVFANR